MGNNTIPIIDIECNYEEQLPKLKKAIYTFHIQKYIFDTYRNIKRFPFSIKENWFLNFNRYKYELHDQKYTASLKNASRILNFALKLLENYAKVVSWPNSLQWEIHFDVNTCLNKYLFSWCREVLRSNFLFQQSNDLLCVSVVC